MPRRKNCRLIAQLPGARAFKPCGRISSEVESIELLFEELEALRLSDLEGMTAEKASLQMGVSRHTYGRELASARRKVAQALVKGQPIIIFGGSHAMGVTSETILEEEKIMKIAISSEGPTLDDYVDPRFGRAAGFVIVEEGEIKQYVENGANQSMGQGAGIGTAALMSDLGVDVVLSGYVGPKAFDALKAAGIKVCQGLDNQTVGQALETFLSGKAMVADAPNKP